MFAYDVLSYGPSYSAEKLQADNRVNGTSTRARIDIRDLNMAGLPSLTAEGDTRPVVVVAKHLCGVAADLALRQAAYFRARGRDFCGRRG